MNSKPYSMAVVSILAVVGFDIFMLYLAYDMMKQGNSQAAFFYASIAVFSFFMVGGVEAHDELKQSNNVDSLPRIPSVAPTPFRRNYKRTTREGYVYVLTALHDDTVYKIGRTNNPSDRLRTFNVKLPFDVEYLHVIKTSDMHALEGQLHRKFGSKRVNGEWFKLDNDDLDYIAGLSMVGG